MSVFRAAVLQMRSGIDPDRNADRFADLVEQAVAADADYIQSPEMTNMVQRDRAGLKARLKSETEDPVAKTAARLAKAHGVTIHVGSIAVALDADRVANRALVFGPNGETIATYDKIHMFDVDLDNGESWRESRTYRPGDKAVVAAVEPKNVRAGLGLAVCYDMRFPHLFREQALLGAGVLTAPAAFTRQTGEAHWHVLLRARAIENGAFMVAAAQGGRHEDGRETYGHSLIVDPWGRILAEVHGDEPGIAVAEIDLAQVAETRSKVPNLANARAFDAGGRAIDVTRTGSFAPAGAPVA
ncbi:carbon-nitrogen hydrolase family protein [Fulvimarina sp. 2208YS6-2-32]|uniref:Carbon-nitrogen hydrolase family protein n=1 Tax=Fulvimarina uroteuthidis TaxID=3098149 RepID=A0ABU5I585_9HYPH|nr:carbon-nitrogen hydrolase family protein [Fulvimarina sp. 2208YS6-2-32]MDY8110539.1 carbon-nitrogen hydrolase family protein [Fulvimarina sp. 2208YS6-2-32]